uniref:Uncharacterized protein n=1 Tax=Bursaphelenchus xylophilus TaxID=6326 RepID=A0A1I7SRK0_BURXY
MTPEMRRSPIFLVFLLLPLLDAQVTDAGVNNATAPDAPVTDAGVNNATAPNAPVTDAPGTEAQVPDDPEQVSAEKLRENFCPHCKPIQTGDFKRFWVIHHKANDTFEYLAQTHLDQPMNEGAPIKLKEFGADLLYPVFSDGQFQPYLVEINDKRQLKLLQIPDANGTVKIQPANGTSQNEGKYYCGHSEKHATLNREKMFFLGGNLILNKDTAVDVSTLCDQEVVKTNPKNISGLGEGGVDDSWISDCFKAVHGRGSCALNIDGKNKTHYALQCEVLYMRNDLIVHSRCTYANGKRCAFFIHDSLTGTNWHIPDDIQFSGSLVPGFHNIRYLVPLIELDDPFFSNGRRFQHSNTTATSAGPAPAPSGGTAITANPTATSVRPTKTTAKTTTTTTKAPEKPAENEPDDEDSDDDEDYVEKAPSMAKRREVIGGYIVIALIVIVFFEF